VLAVLAAAAVVLYFVLGRIDGEPARAAAPTPPDAAPAPVAVVEPVVVVPDAGVTAAALPPDAAVRVAVTKRPPDRPRTRPAASAARVPPLVVDPPVVEPKAELKRRRNSIDRRYVALGEAIQAIAKDQGKAAAAPLWAQYRRIPLADAMIKDAMVGQVETALTELEGKARALRAD
jgi:hypothetical protein